MSDAHGNTSDIRALLTGLWMVPSSGGAVKTIERFRRALEADVVSFTDGGELDSEGSAVEGAVHIRTGRGILGSRFSWVPASRLGPANELAQRCSLISCHAFYRYHVLWARTWARRRHIPYWVVPHGIFDPYVLTYRSLQKRIFLRLLGRSFLRNAAHVIFSTERERAKASCVYSGSNTRVVYWPVEPIGIEGRSDVRARIRSELGIPGDARVLIYLGRLHSMKRPLETIEAVARAKVPGLHLLVVGPEEGVTRAEGEARAAALGFSGLHMLGPVFGKRKDELLLASDAFISLSIRENFGHSAAEAMSATLPVILSPGNDIVGELKSTRCGWFLESDSIVAASCAVRSFSDAERNMLFSMGGAGRTWVCDELSFERFRLRLRALASEALHCNRR